MQQPTPLEQIFRPRAEGEMDLIIETANIMRKTGFTEEKVQIFLNDPSIVQVHGMNPSVQQHRLNAYFNSQYMANEVDTSQERSFLHPAAPPQEWLRVFEMYHAVKLKSLDLPFAW